MNRLRKLARAITRKAEAITLFHGTSLQRLDNIASTGIAAGASSSFRSTTSTQTFFTDDMWRAFKYTEYAINKDDPTKPNCCVILDVNLDTNILQPDKDDCSKCETWEDSMLENNQVAVNGSVPASNISQIRLYDDHSDDPFWSGTVGEYLANAEQIKSDYLATGDITILQKTAKS